MLLGRITACLANVVRTTLAAHEPHGATGPRARRWLPLSRSDHHAEYRMHGHRRPRGLVDDQRLSPLISHRCASRQLQPGGTDVEEIIWH